MTTYGDRTARIFTPYGMVEADVSSKTSRQKFIQTARKNGLWAHTPKQASRGAHSPWTPIIASGAVWIAPEAVQVITFIDRI
jgi:hypothetical protein